MKAKATFLLGAVLGLLAGSRIGPGLYKRAAAGASALANHPAVRRGASTAGDRAANAAKNAGNNAAVQVKNAGNAVAHRFGERWHDALPSPDEHFPDEQFPGEQVPGESSPESRRAGGLGATSANSSVGRGSTGATGSAGSTGGADSTGNGSGGHAGNGHNAHNGWTRSDSDSG